MISPEEPVSQTPELSTVSLREPNVKWFRVDIGLVGQVCLGILPRVGSPERLLIGVTLTGVTSQCRVTLVILRGVVFPESANLNPNNPEPRTSPEQPVAQNTELRIVSPQLSVLPKAHAGAKFKP